MAERLRSARAPSPSKDSNYEKEELGEGPVHQEPDSKTRRWWNKLSSGAGEENVTQRGMQSRHLMMIGEYTGALDRFRPHAFIGGFPAFAQTFVYAFYSFGGIELVAIAAGESAKPYRSVPRAIKATFFRIILFYVLAILTIGLCINYKDPTLLTAAFGGSKNITTEDEADLEMALAFSCLTFLTTIWGEGIVFTWLLNITGISALLVWTSIGLISLRFRQAYIARGLKLEDLPYRQPLYPLLPIGVLILGTLMFIAQGYAANVVATYIGVALYIILYSGYTIYERMQGKTQHFVPVSEIDFVTDAVWKPGEGVAIREQDKKERQAQQQPMGWQRILDWVKSSVY
ncbi:hypothetical protein H0H81_003140 [Sphagnurus paluster]|uniref:Amino acid permease/ SLC12A domain-containing protein n=1 Tax=Sphagnurus paluster TaxID=117069 RepID=A0A9P7FTE7_9AGAR|nr:hypothetical protein H0H81_003140 [Sphagnurus paluster]